MASKGKKDRIAKAGLAKLMGEQEALLGELMREMENNKALGNEKKFATEDVVRNLEKRLDEVKWPVRNQEKIRELEDMVRENDPVAYRRYQAENIPAYQRPVPNSSLQGQGGGYRDSLDQLQASMKAGEFENDYGPAIQSKPRKREEASQESEYDESRERRRRKKEMRQKLRLQEKIARQQEEYDKPVPDPSVLAYVFNPFRLMPWNIPSVDKYRNEVEELERKRKDKQKEAEIANAEAEILEKRKIAQAEALEAKKQAIIKQKKLKAKESQKKKPSLTRKNSLELKKKKKAVILIYTVTFKRWKIRKEKEKGQRDKQKERQEDSESSRRAKRY